MTPEHLRDRWLRALGGFPERTPLDARVVERVEEDTYVREKVWFWSEPHEPVPAYLLLPKGAPSPAPAVLCLHQHAGQFHLGKSEPAGLAGDPDMAYARELTARGYVTITPDLKGFEERRDSVLEGARFEHYLAGRALVEGHTLQRRHLWDLIRALDYLGERPEVDTTRIGCIGHSLGGQEAYMLMATDERPRAGVVNCGVATVQSFFDHKVVHNWSWYLPGYLDLGDTPALLDLIAPRPLCLLAGTRDPIFPVPGVQAVADRAAARYRDLDAPAAFDALLFDGGHVFPPENHERAYAWLDRWLRAPGER